MTLAASMPGSGRPGAGGQAPPAYPPGALCVKLPLALPHSFLPAPCLDLVPSWQTVGSGEAPTALVSLRSGPLNEGGRTGPSTPPPKGEFMKKGREQGVLEVRSWGL